MHHDPNYIYVDSGAEFGRKHAAAYQMQMSLKIM